VAVAQDGEAYAVEWQVTDDDPRSWVRNMWWGVVIFALPGLAILIGGRGDAWAALGAAGFVLVGFVIGLIDWWRGRRAVVAMRLEPLAEPVQLMVRRIDGSVETCPVAAVDRVRVTRYDSDPPSLSMRLWIEGRMTRTRSGPVAPAEELLRLLAAEGATVTTREISTD
jgi:hypothetical protein